MTASSLPTRLGRLAPPETFAGRVLRLSRPRFWLYLAGPVLVGLAYGAHEVSALLRPVSLALFAYFLVPANVLLYGVNDVFDADVDRQNPKKGDSGREARFEGDRRVLGAVALSGLLAVPLAFALPPVGIGALAGFLALAVAYSAPPVRFKTTPLLDSVSNGLYVVPGVVAYAAVAGALPPAGAILGGWLWAMAMHTFSAIPDVEPDRAAGIRTTATLLGERRTLAYCAVVWLAAATVMATVHPWLGGLFALYPALALGIAWSDVAVARAYWWFPAINGLAGMVLTLGGLWGLVYGW